MKITEKQLAANRANAAFARGPITPEGKKRSSQNALRHGITAQTTIMTEQDRIEHDNFVAAILADLAPVGTLETFHASSIAEEAWRLNYCRAQCNNLIAVGHFDGTGDAYDADHAEINTAIVAAITTRENAKTLELLSLYALRIHRIFEKHTEKLEKLQAERLARHQADLEEARLLSQVAKLKHLPYVPAHDGFVFSNDEIDRHTDRFHRLILGKEENLSFRCHAGLFELPKEMRFPHAA